MKQRAIYIVRQAYGDKGMFTVTKTRYFTNKKLAIRFLKDCKHRYYNMSDIEEQPIQNSEIC